MKKLIPRLYRRKARVSKNISGTAEKPRVALHRSNKFTYGQVIDDTAGKTLAMASSQSFDSKDVTKVQSATQAGAQLGEQIKKLKITQLVIDRSRFHYQGRIAAFVEGIRSVGIQV